MKQQKNQEAIKNYKINLKGVLLCPLLPLNHVLSA